MYRYLVLVSLFCVLSGCAKTDSQYVEVSGVITVDGKPLEGATVMFVPQNAKNSVGRKLQIAHGVTDGDGRYQLSRPGGAIGAAVGKHSVMVSKIDPIIDLGYIRGKARETVLRKSMQGAETELSSEELLARNVATIALSDFLSLRHKRDLLLESVKIADPIQTVQPFGETVFDSFNLNTVLRFEVSSEGTADADFEVGRDPLLEE